MIDIIFFNPPRQKNGNKGLFNNAMLWLVSYLINKGFSAKIIHLTGEDYLEKVKYFLDFYKPKFCAISCKWWDTLYSSIHLAEFIKKYNPNIKLIAGGNTASSFAKEIINNSCFDYVIRGDAELPLEQILKNNIPDNSFYKIDNKIYSTDQNFILDEKTVNETYLVENLEEIIEPKEIINKYIWTGKGCTSNCFFCAGANLGQTKLFYRKNYLYRDVSKVINDCKIIAKYTDNNLMFDFDPLSVKKIEYYQEILKSLPQKTYKCNQFYFWYLPPQKLIKTISETFTSAIIGIDVQIFSESQREKLSKLNIIKPKFYSNDKLDEILRYCNKFSNLKITLSGFLGMPYETDVDISNAYKFFEYFIKKYPQIISTSINPVIVEPDSPLVLTPEKYNVLPLRKTFFDFYELTKYTYETLIFERNFKDIEEHIKYFGMMRIGYDENKLFYEFYKIQDFISNLR